MKKARVVSLACNTLTGTPLHSYQILLKYALGYESYGAHKEEFMNFCFRGDKYRMKKVRVVSLTRDAPTGPPLHSCQIL